MQCSVCAGGTDAAAPPSLSSTLSSLPSPSYSDPHRLQHQMQCVLETAKLSLPPGGTAADERPDLVECFAKVWNRGGNVFVWGGGGGTAADERPDLVECFAKVRTRGVCGWGSGGGRLDACCLSGWMGRGGMCMMQPPAACPPLPPPLPADQQKLLPQPAAGDCGSRRRRPACRCGFIDHHIGGGCRPARGQPRSPAEKVQEVWAAINPITKMEWAPRSSEARGDVVMT